MSKYPRVPPLPITADIHDTDSVLTAIGKFLELVAEVNPSKFRPVKPLKPFEQTPAATRAYADALEVYEADMAEYTAWLVDAKRYNNAIETAIEDFIKKESGLNTSVPEPYRANVWRKAWNDGHSGGYYEVYQELCELVDIFE